MNVRLISSALALCSLFTVPAMAQQQPAPPPGPPPARAEEGSLKLDFGAGRRVDIKCGKTSLEDCIRLATPLINKVADSQPTPPPPHGDKKKP